MFIGDGSYFQMKREETLVVTVKHPPIISLGWEQNGTRGSRSFQPQPKYLAAIGDSKRGEPKIH